MISELRQFHVRFDLFLFLHFVYITSGLTYFRFPNVYSFHRKPIRCNGTTLPNINYVVMYIICVVA